MAELTVRCHIAQDESSSYGLLDDSTNGTSVSVPSMQCESGREKLISSQPKTETTIIAHSRGSKPPTFFPLALLVTIFCNCPFGCIALIFSISSERNYKKGETMKAQTQGNISKWFSIVGIAVTSVLIMFLIVYFVSIKENIINSQEDLT
ncbi:hypothetical protein CHS0354_008795 [Potamilus streckersoni]|uniref:Uncharacterized protein n=1 Tax=Potamilus streckersoni TaxID=2493646 RepID=A0AAE0SNU1_9BIVA|nr:hypothetical protein CHS0354_008795 [Potamilus streckersoni]